MEGLPGCHSTTIGLVHLPPSSDPAPRLLRSPFCPRSKQINYITRNGWVPCLEFSEDTNIYLNTRMGPGYYDNRYWSMYKLPMFGCTDSSEVVREIENCKKDFPKCAVRLVAFDAKRQVQVGGFMVKRN